MDTELKLLILTAISISFLHTLSGPDHYLPFVALSRARGWSLKKTIGLTVICGCGHVWSSVLLGSILIAIGWTLSSIKGLETIRGGFAGWLLLLFGICYTIWGYLNANKIGKHKHFDVGEDGSVFVYEHNHGNMVGQQKKYRVTPWVLFVIFVLGPSEPMIPMLYLPAARASWWSLLVLILCYTLFTLFAMVLMVISGYYGLRFLNTGKLEKYMHVLGGVSMLICGVGVVFLNW